MDKRLKTALILNITIILLALMLTGCSADIALSSSESSLADDESSSYVTSADATSVTDELPGSDTSAPVTTAVQVSPKLLSSADDIALTETGEGSYTFTYNGEQFTALYTPDNWKIIDSYRIRNKEDMAIICEALISICPIHGRDYESYRTPEDLAYEWDQHNIAYDMLPDTSRWKQNTKDVDLNPEDQGKSFIDMARDRLEG